MARYIERAPLSLEKLSIQDDIVTYTSKDDAACDFDPLEFLATLSCHIPKTYESVTRYYGRYSSRRRGERAKRAASTRSGEGAVFGLGSSVIVLGSLFLASPLPILYRCRSSIT